MNLQNEILETFYSEAREHIEASEADLMALEKAGSDYDPPLINKLFRQMHTLKGNAGLLGFDSITKVAHVMESMLSRMRDGVLTPTPESVTCLLSGLDLLNSLLNDPEVDQGSTLTAYLATVEVILAAAKMEEKASATTAEPTVAGPAKDKYENTIEGFHIFENEPNPTAETEPLANSNRVEGYHVFDDTPAAPPPAQLAEKSNVIPLVAAKTVVAPPKAQNESVPKVALKKMAPEVKSSSVRIKVDQLEHLMHLAGELVLVRNQYLQLLKPTCQLEQALAQRLNSVTSEIQETVMKTRMDPIGSILVKLERTVHDLANKLGKKVDLVLIGKDVELDRNILEALNEPLLHMLRNACDHAIEMPEDRFNVGKPRAGKVVINAFHAGGQINIQIKDDGKGIDAAKIREKALEKRLYSEKELALMSDQTVLAIIFQPGFSCAEKVTDVSGRGVGMDVVKSSIEKFRGSIDIDSAVGVGTTITLSLPLTLAIVPCLIVSVAGRRYAIPQFHIEELVRLFDQDVFRCIETANDLEIYRLRHNLLPLIRLNEVLARRDQFDIQTRKSITDHYRGERREIYDKYCKQADGDNMKYSEHSLNIVVLKHRNSSFGLVVDKLHGTEEIVVSPMHSDVKKITVFSGATIMGDGSIAMILDVNGIIQHSGIRLSACHDINSEMQKSVDLVSQHHISHNIVVFRSGSQREQFAFELSAISRIEMIDKNSIERVGNMRFIHTGGISVEINTLDTFLSVSPFAESDRMPFILLKDMTKPFGILCSEIIDVGQIPFRLDAPATKHKAVRGTTRLRDKLTLFIEPEYLREARISSLYTIKEDDKHAVA